MSHRLRAGAQTNLLNSARFRAGHHLQHALDAPRSAPTLFENQSLDRREVVPMGRLKVFAGRPSRSGVEASGPRVRSRSLAERGGQIRRPAWCPASAPSTMRNVTTSSVAPDCVSAARISEPSGCGTARQSTSSRSTTAARSNHRGSENALTRQEISVASDAHAWVARPAQLGSTR